MYKCTHGLLIKKHTGQSRKYLVLKIRKTKFPSKILATIARSENSIVRKHRSKARNPKIIVEVDRVKRVAGATPCCNEQAWRANLLWEITRAELQKRLISSGSSGYFNPQ